MYIKNLKLFVRYNVNAKIFKTLNDRFCITRRLRREMIDSPDTHSLYFYYQTLVSVYIYILTARRNEC